MVELVDSVDLGSTANACRFESCCPHQKREPVRALFFGAAGLEPIVGKDCKATGRPRYEREKPLKVFLLAFMEQGYPSLV